MYRDFIADRCHGTEYGFGGHEVVGGVREDQVAAGRHGVQQRADGVVGDRVVGDEMQYRNQHQRHRLGGVERVVQGRVGQDAVGVGQVGLQVGGLALGSAGQQRPCVGELQR